LNWDQFTDHLKSGKLSLCYLITSDDPYLVRQAIERLRSTFFGSDPGEVLRFVAPSELREAIETAGSLSFFSSKQLIVLESAESLKASHKKILGPYLASPEESTVLVLTAGEGATKSPPKWVRDACVELDLRSDPGRTRQWIRQWFRHRQINLSSSVLQMIESRGGSVFGALLPDLEKMELAVGAGGAITPELVQTLVRDQGEESVFAAIGAVRKGDLGEAAHVLERLLAQKVPPEQILALFARATKLSWALGLPETADKKNAEMAAGLSLSAAWVGRARSYRESLRAETARRGWHALGRADTHLKTGSHSPAMCLLAAIAEMALLARKP
jgi:DNA polymerase III delta subunit